MPFTDPAGRDRLTELPPSAKLVAKILELEQELTHRELVDATLLPDRTVHHALDRLQGVGLVDWRYGLTDANTRVYSLQPM